MQEFLQRLANSGTILEPTSSDFYDFVDRGTATYSLDDTGLTIP